MGAENIFIFGRNAEGIEDLGATASYAPRKYYESDTRLRRVFDALASDRFCPREPGLLRSIPDRLLIHDPYFVIADFASYVEKQAQVSLEYRNQEAWLRKAILNVARMGHFSSDRTVEEYAREIWRLGVRPGIASVEAEAE